VRFLLCWHFPYRHMREVGWWHGESDPIVRNHYALRFEDARRVAEYVIPRLPDLWERTARFVEGIVARHPAPIAESALNCLAVLRSPTVFRLEDGTFCGFEGCNADTGCCFGSCTHVWNYEQATLSLFPDLHRSMLEAHLRYGTMDDGAHRFRLDLPLGANAYALAAADGQMGLIVRSYMQYRRTGDRAWLERWYPTLKKLLAFAWQPGSWDADQDGVMEGAQHNTYDVEFFGPNPCVRHMVSGGASERWKRRRACWAIPSLPRSAARCSSAAAAGWTRTCSTARFMCSKSAPCPTTRTR
jgi:non-lysosomal glucosylceramidase